MLFMLMIVSSCQSKKRTGQDVNPGALFELVYVHPGPVITLGDPGTEDNRWGFEGGRAHKIRETYHLFTTETFDEPHWVKTRLAHWTSKNGTDWRREGHVFESSGDFTGTDPKAALWSPMTYWIPEKNKWYLSYVAYTSAPDLDTAFLSNHNGEIWLAASQTPGIEGIGGPYTDTLMLMRPDDSSQSWEGLQGVDSWYPFRLADGSWLSFYGSAQTQYNPIPFWGVGLAESPSFFGPWTRKKGTNPVLIDSTFVENPIVDTLPDGRYVAWIDGGPVKNQFAWSVSKDGIHWSPATYIDLEKKTVRWWRDYMGMRTPLGMIPEKNGEYTVFFTALDENSFGHLGMCRLKLK
jgi:hypothetical protein